MQQCGRITNAVRKIFGVICRLSKVARGYVNYAKHLSATVYPSESQFLDQPVILSFDECIHCFSVNKEKNALAVTHSDFVVKIFYALESRSRIYLVSLFLKRGLFI